MENVVKNIERMRNLHKEGKLQTLDLDNALKFKGKEIEAIYFGYRGQDGYQRFTVGNLISSLDFARRDTTVDGYANRAEYWESYMSKSQIAEEKDTLFLLTDEGKNIYFRAHPKSDVFTCGDIDRVVFFKPVENEN